MRALIFDLDGTLIDSVYAHTYAWQRAFGEAGRPIEAWRIHRRIGMSGGQFVRALAGEIGWRVGEREAEALATRSGRIYARSPLVLRALPGAVALLRDLRRQRIPHGLATSAAPGDVTKAVRPLRLPRATVIVDSGDVSATKPEPDLFLRCREELGVPAGDCYVVGDAVWDILAARRAGMLGIGVRTGGISGEELTAAGAFRVFRDVGELHTALEELGLRAG
ncbi:MAG TPA: HAD family hydrolase [Candidatus Saccharimonadales bacterium]|nr:HAD family hydrolase [Candidatus Saccharimonadales bacterium]